jgi:hypothetical protein
VHLRVSDLFGCRLIKALDFEIQAVQRAATRRPARRSRIRAVHAVLAVGPELAAVFTAEIGDVHRITSAARPTS